MAISCPRNFMWVCENQSHDTIRDPCVTISLNEVSFQIIADKKTSSKGAINSLICNIKLVVWGFSQIWEHYKSCQEIFKFALIVSISFFMWKVFFPIEFFQ
jgi:hypothetical protein